MIVRRQIQTFHPVAVVEECGAYVTAFRYAIAVFITAIGMINPNQRVKCNHYLHNRNKIPLPNIIEKKH